MLEFTVRELRTAAELAAADELRAESWRRGRPSQAQRLANAGYFEPPTARAVRVFGAFQGLRLVGTGRVSVHESLDDVPEAHVYGIEFLAGLRMPIASINRLVVHLEYRRQGVAGRLDAVRLRTARESGCSAVIGWWTPKSGDYRLRQLRRLGFMEVDQSGPRRDPLFDEMLPLWLDLATPVA